VRVVRSVRTIWLAPAAWLSHVVWLARAI
jgi:hypothetical protein